MFLGEFQRGIDKKGRLTLPAAFRDVLGDEPAVITKGLDKCLFLFPASQFKELSQKVRELGYSPSDARRLRRHFYSSASTVRPDSMGRINLPPKLRQYADLTNEAIVAGVDAYVEIWNVQRWEEEINPEDGEDGISAERWEDLGI
jgi:MraZ protein